MKVKRDTPKSAWSLVIDRHVLLVLMVLLYLMLAPDPSLLVTLLESLTR